MFGYADNISRVVDNALELDAMDVVGALNYLASTSSRARRPPAPPMARGDMDEKGPLTAPVLCQVLLGSSPRTRCVDESLTTGATYWDCSLIGGLPFTHSRSRAAPSAAARASRSARRSPVLIDEWSTSRPTARRSTRRRRLVPGEGLDVTTIICKNDAYRILDVERATRGWKWWLEVEAPHGLVGPAFGWVSLARGYGVGAFP